jgi:hypothetical protein
MGAKDLGPTDGGNLNSAASLARSAALGRTVESFMVFGPNNLKTLVSPQVLVGQTLDHVGVDEDRLVLGFGVAALRVDLQRTGAVVFRRRTENTPLPTGIRPPTARLLLDGGSLDFVEPSKTKRISFWLEITPSPSVPS